MSSQSSVISPSPHITIFYHYFYPDDVVSARHFSDLAAGLKQRGWRVTVSPCNRGCRDETVTYPEQEEWNGVAIQRIWRPRLRQSSSLGRMLNAVWMLTHWSLKAITAPRSRDQVMLVGTDPVLSVLTVLPWRLLRQGCVIAHWCFDLYPEAAIADGMFREDSRLVRALKRLLKLAYQRVDILADLGSCMRQRFKQYGSPATVATLPPWSLVEPKQVVEPDDEVRRSLFGQARLGLIYSGSFGRAHSYTEFLDLARLVRDESIHFSFAGRGNRMDDLKAAVTPEDINVSFAGFAPESELEKRLGAGDIHLVSLRPEWTGTVVPSKFFGALAAGRAVLFAGSPDSVIARWIEEYQVGWLLTPRTLPDVAKALKELSRSPQRLEAMRQRCHQVYQQQFSREMILNRWDQLLRERLQERRKMLLHSHR